MSDETFRADRIDSPCIRICTIHPDTRLCVGCLRSLDEISDWSRMTPAARQAVMETLPARADRHKVRRGGRLGKLARSQ
ncbi:DUF1289 domain-containing protein [Jannaschia aquimarina]|uniref:Fe-S protein n=1 Tax=Jannaschia aquimarina TaxID=935700 RepID=A0A0D1D7L6_9RHOB|nr:DUF1289 domain-containing protein [Jannaschia aquimarina]KIT15973.1 hypothetical protein jaqu_22430 [Jannaschia aquimarina]SNS99035.1 hypothetical protein SAMN05421775_104154 [Jannaschia aquimarina]